MTRTRSVGVALLFLVTLLVVPAGLLVSRFASEPYPALLNPAFPGAQEDDGRTTITEPSAVLELADGRRQAIDYADLFPETPMRASTLLSNAYGTQERADDPRTRRWLAQWLDERFPESDVVAVDLTWQRVTYLIATQEELGRTVDREVRIELDGLP